jgi:acetyltransferase-like isoleucine patch superfamily enzyme
MSSTHNFKQAGMVPYDEVELLSPVKVGEAVWIGARAIILPGVSLGTGCVVGAGSVVTASFSEGNIVAGNPARAIGTRDMSLFRDMLIRGQTYIKLKRDLKLQKRDRVG